MRKLLGATAVLTGSLALVAATQGTSHAAAPANATATAAQSVPSCVTVNAWEFVGLMVTEIHNTCDSTQSVTATYTNDYGDPVPCFTLAPDEQVTHSQRVWPAGEFTGLEPC